MRLERGDAAGLPACAGIDQQMVLVLGTGDEDRVALSDVEDVNLQPARDALRSRRRLEQPGRRDHDARGDDGPQTAQADSVREGCMHGHGAAPLVP